MKLYLIRHGIAAERGTYQNDDERPLIPKGVTKTQAVARRWQEIKINFDLILTSPLIRARQTAEIWQTAGLSSHIQEFSPLAPGGEIQQWLEWCGKNRYSSLALVGHQPDLGNWAEMLIWGSCQDKLILKKAGMIGLKTPEGQISLGCCEMFLLTGPKWLI